MACQSSIGSATPTEEQIMYMYVRTNRAIFTTEESSGDTFAFDIITFVRRDVLVITDLDRGFAGIERTVE